MLTLGLEERRKRERESRRNAILKSARKLFFEKGFKSVTVESIARKAELSKGSIYLHYNSKEEIYTQILLIDIEKFHERIAGLPREAKSAAVALSRLADTYVDFFLNDRELFRILMNFMLHPANMNLPEDLNAFIIKTTHKTVNVIEEIFQCGIDRGEFSPTINLRMFRNALWGLLNGIISLHLFTGSESRRAELIRETIKESLKVFIQGLRVSERVS
jgi:AcrR family transcriptional regulator